MESMNNAEKSMTHISHLHPLKLVDSPKPRPICHACNMSCAAKSFGCIKCRYYLHSTCATTGKSVNHPGQKAHTLTFELTPTYTAGQFQCNACGEEGSTFCFKCGECDYDLHLHCASLPQRVSHHSHRHPLSLVFDNPFSSDIEFSCDMCEKNLNTNTWFYLCKSCDFGGHVGCFAPETVEVISPGLQVAQPQVPVDIGDLTTQMQSMMAHHRMVAQSMAVTKFTSVPLTAPTSNNVQYKSYKTIKLCCM